MLQAEELIFQQCEMVVRTLASEPEWMISSPWNHWKNLLVLSERIPSHQAIRNQFQVFRRDGLILSDLCHVDLDESSPTIAPSKEITLPFNHFLPCFHRRSLRMSSD